MTLGGWVHEVDCTGAIAVVVPILCKCNIRGGGGGGGGGVHDLNCSSDGSNSM